MQNKSDRRLIKRDIWQMEMFATKQYIGKHKYIKCCEKTVQTSFVSPAVDV